MKKDKTYIQEIIQLNVQLKKSEQVINDLSFLNVVVFDALSDVCKKYKVDMSKCLAKHEKKIKEKMKKTENKQ